MKQREIELLLAYFLNYQTILEGELIELRNNVRHRHIDPVDCLELSLAIERLAAFREFSKNVRALLQLSNVEFEKENEE